MKRIITTINKKTGAITVKSEGFDGPSCLEATRKLREKFGMTDADIVPTEEMYQQATDEAQQLGGS